MNVEALRRKRAKRLGVKVTLHTGQRRIFFILDRGTKKFPGDVGLWMQSIEYARRQKAHKKVSHNLTKMLRLHPTKPELWIYSAQFVLDEHADMLGARNYMQRGLRFCKSSRKLWLEYAKLEILYIVKISARREILGLSKGSNKPTTTNHADDLSGDVVRLPELTNDDVNPTADEDAAVLEITLRNVDSTPALSGAVPIAVFDAAMEQFQNDVELAKAFYDVVSEFESIPCSRKILGYIVQSMLKSSKTSWETQACYTKVAVTGINVSSSDFPKALGSSLNRLKEAIFQVEQKATLAKDLKKWLQALSENISLDPALQKIVSASIRKLDQGFSKHARTPEAG